MATVELFEALSRERADGWHRVTAPGGYEWWEFDIEDKSGRIRLVVSFFEGYPLHPQYLQRYDAYRRRPTLRTPPTPREYPCVHWAVYEAGIRLGSAIMQYPAGTFKADESTGGFAFGANRLTIGREEISIRLRGGDDSISGDLIFQPVPLGEPVEKRFLPAKFGPHHRWILANPLGETRGEIRLAGRTIELSGSGYHDHYYGNGPIGPDISSWMRGRVILPPGALAFQFAMGRALVVTIDETGIKDLGDVRFNGAWDRRSGWGLPFPSAMKFGEAFILRNPRIVDSTAASLRLVFDAYVDGEMAEAWAEIVYPERLKRSFAGWRMNRAIRRMPAG